MRSSTWPLATIALLGGGAISTAGGYALARWTIGDQPPRYAMVASAAKPVPIDALLTGASLPRRSK